MKLHPLLLASAVFAVSLSGCTSNPGGGSVVERGTDTIDPTLPTQLPRTAIPSHYSIDITPHAGALTFDASVAIDLKVIKPTRALTLNAADLSIASATLKSGNGQPLQSRIRTDADAQTATFDFGRELAPGDYHLDVRYSGKINTQANGLFALDYTNVDGKPTRALFTQFEPADARRFVPSWDEPDYKAPFDLTVTVPAGAAGGQQHAEPGARCRPTAAATSRFRTTPAMSSYLLFLAIGEFDRITTTRPATESRHRHPPRRRRAGPLGARRRGADPALVQRLFRHALSAAQARQCRRPGHSQFFGAMENWGAIFTFENDPARRSGDHHRSATPGDLRRRRARNGAPMVRRPRHHGLVGRPLAQRGLRLVDGDQDDRSISTPNGSPRLDRIDGREAAITLDSLATTHPVVQHVPTVEQMSQAFDSITYQKGEAVITMLEDYVGEDGVAHGRARLYRRSRLGTR